MRHNRILAASIGMLAILAGLVAVQYTVMGVEVLASPSTQMSHTDRALSALIPSGLTIGALYLGFRFLLSAFPRGKSM
jgi:hypothetical protein